MQGSEDERLDALKRVHALDQFGASIRSAATVFAMFHRQLLDDGCAAQLAEDLTLQYAGLWWRSIIWPNTEPPCCGG